MSKIQIKVEYVNKAKEGKKMATIKTEDGRYFEVYPEKLDAFKSGGEYAIEYKSRDFNGKTYHTVTDVATVTEPASNGNGDTNGNGILEPGETWTPELALPFVIERSKFPADFMASEVDRYLGWPGQAISYKVGERVLVGAITPCGQCGACLSGHGSQWPGMLPARTLVRTVSRPSFHRRK